jgi:hypothetical protein
VSECRSQSNRQDDETDKDEGQPEQVMMGDSLAEEN